MKAFLTYINDHDPIHVLTLTFQLDKSYIAEKV